MDRCLPRTIFSTLCQSALARVLHERMVLVQCRYNSGPFYCNTFSLQLRARHPNKTRNLTKDLLAVYSVRKTNVENYTTEYGIFVTIDIGFAILRVVVSPE